VIRIIGTRGIEAASVRTVAAEAGVSAGAVQRCFATKEELLRFVLHQVNARFTARVQARMAQQPDPTDQAVGLRVIIDEMLPLDDERRLTCAATLALLAHSATQPAAAAIMRSAYQGAHAFFMRAFDRDTAVGLYAIISGLQGPLLVGAITADQAQTIVEKAISR
jgi:AcrR family transcriptional regulator